MKHDEQPFWGPGNKGVRRVNMKTGNEHDSKSKSDSEPDLKVQ